MECGASKKRPNSISSSSDQVERPTKKSKKDKKKKKKEEKARKAQELQDVAARKKDDKKAATNLVEVLMKFVAKMYAQPDVVPTHKFPYITIQGWKSALERMVQCMLLYHTSAFGPGDFRNRLNEGYGNHALLIGVRPGQADPYPQIKVSSLVSRRDQGARLGQTDRGGPEFVSYTESADSKGEQENIKVHHIGWVCAQLMKNRFDAVHAWAKASSSERRTDKQVGHRSHVRRPDVFDCSPWHFCDELLDTKSNHDHKGCRYGCALFCPHNPKCLWFDEQGHRDKIRCDPNTVLSVASSSSSSSTSSSSSFD